MSDIVARIQRDIQQDSYYGQNFANNGECFIAWYLRNVLLRSPIQARDDITDGQDDKQIDAVIVDDDKRQVIIIQGKFFSTTKVDHAQLHEVLAAWLHIQNLPALQESANQRLKVKLEAVSEALQDDYEVVFELLTTGELSDSAKDDLKSFAETLGEYEHPVASLTVVDTQTLQARWDEALMVALPKLKHSLTLEQGRYLSLQVANFKTVLAAIKLSDVLRLPGVKDQTLFRKNVRQSLGLNVRDATLYYYQPHHRLRQSRAASHQRSPAPRPARAAVSPAPGSAPRVPIQSPHTASAVSMSNGNCVGHCTAGNTGNRVMLA